MVSFMHYSPDVLEGDVLMNISVRSRWFMAVLAAQVVQ